MRFRLGLGLSRKFGPFRVGVYGSKPLFKSGRRTRPSEQPTEYMHDAHLRMIEELHLHHALTDDEYATIRARIMRAVAVWQAKQRLEK